MKKVMFRNTKVRIIYRHIRHIKTLNGCTYIVVIVLAFQFQLADIKSQQGEVDNSWNVRTLTASTGPF